jgi:hypothetical protein
MQPKKFLPVFLLCLGLFFSLACELVNAMTDPGKMRIESVDVVPSSQAGKYTASVALPFHNQEGNLQCYVVLKNKQQKDVYRQTVPPSDSSSILTFDFELSEPGTHKLYCLNPGYGSSASTTFTVNSPPAGQDTSPGETVDNPPADAEHQYPLKISGTGTWRLYSGENACAAAVKTVLTINAEGLALLEASGPGFIDHINCTQSSGVEAWSIIGTADLNSETAMFTSCNNAGFTASGLVKYHGGSLSGKVTCRWANGDATGKTAMDLALP